VVSNNGNGGVDFVNYAAAAPAFKFWTGNQYYAQFRQNGLDIVGNGTAITTGTDLIDAHYNFNGGALINISNGNAGNVTQAGYGINNGVSGVNLWLTQTGPGYVAGANGIGPNTGYLYADRRLALLSGQQDGSPVDIIVKGIKVGTFEFGSPDPGIAGLSLSYTGGINSNIKFGNTSGGGYLTSYGAGNFNLSGGCYTSAGQWFASATNCTIVNGDVNSIGFFMSSGNTVGSAPAVTQVGNWQNTGLTISNGVDIENHLTIFGYTNNLVWNTWTPILSATVTPPTYTVGTAQGYYWTLGPYWFWSFWLSWSGATGGNGSLLVSGLPFTNTASTNAYTGASCYNWGGTTLTLDAGYTNLGIQAGPTGSSFTVVENGSGQTAGNILPYRNGSGQMLCQGWSKSP
jgi:hypothetical protein